MKNILYLPWLLIILFSCLRVSPDKETPSHAQNTAETKSDNEWLTIGGEKINKYDEFGYYLLRNEYYLESEAESIVKVYLDMFSDDESGRRGGLDGIEKLINLKKLYIVNAEMDTLDFSPLYTLRNLEEIGFSTRENNAFVFPDLSGLASRESVSIIWIGSTGPTNLKNIEYLSNVNHVQITAWNGYNFVLSGLEFLCQLDNLEQLEILNAYNSTFQIIGIASLSKLKTLELQFKEIDINGIQRLGNLEYLNFNESEIQNISALSGLKNLITLEIKIKEPEPDINFIEEMKSLQDLYILGEPKPTHSSDYHYDDSNYTADQILDLSIIGNLTQLNSLKLVGFVLKNIASLNNLNNIETVWVYNSILMDSTESTVKKLSWDSSYGR
jgi:hypothetical protein